MDGAAEGVEVAVLPREVASGIGGEVAVQHLHIDRGLLGIRPAVDEVPRLERNAINQSAQLADVFHHLLHRALEFGFESLLCHNGGVLDDSRAVFGIEVIEASEVDAGVGIGRGTGAVALQSAQQFRVRCLPRGGFVAVGGIEVSQLRRGKHSGALEADHRQGQFLGVGLSVRIVVLDEQRNACGVGLCGHSGSKDSLAYEVGEVSQHRPLGLRYSTAWRFRPEPPPQL